MVLRNVVAVLEVTAAQNGMLLQWWSMTSLGCTA